VTAMQAPKNRQEFLSMQQQAAAAARDMQRRATLPMPPRQIQDPPRPQFRQPEPLHHKSPSQQARQAASYGRMQPQMRRQEWQAPPQTAKRPQPQSQPQPRETYHRHQRQPQRQNHYQEDPRFREPPSPPPPPPAANTMPPLADLLGMLGGLGGLGGTAAQESPAAPESAFGDFAPEAGKEGGMDSILMLLLLFLLQKESADQGLLLALMYIMM